MMPRAPQRSARPCAGKRPDRAMAAPRLLSCLRRSARDWEYDTTPLCAARGSGQNYLLLRSTLLGDSFSIPCKGEAMLRPYEFILFQAIITSAVTNIEPADRTMLPSFFDNSSAHANADSTGLTPSN